VRSRRANDRPPLTRAVDPNVVERAALFIALAEILVDERAPRLARLPTPNAPTQEDPSC